MLIVGVIDVLDGRAVHARGGHRDQYQAIRSVAGMAISGGDPVQLARAYIDRLGVQQLYVADLDAIGGRRLQDALVARVVGLGAPVWLDAGVSSAEHARQLAGLNVARVIVGLETLTSWTALDDICTAIDGARVGFSLDLREGAPVISGDIPRDDPPLAIAARAAGRGVGTIVVIDLARVGSSTGVDRALIQGVRAAAPGVTLAAGGGIRGVEDLEVLADLGCEAALVASALHDGRIRAGDVAALQSAGRLRR
jgi:phosphoribosylformimino-5-aminoimidazole carboxamide ribotide isomerase